MADIRVESGASGGLFAAVEEWTPSRGRTAFPSEIVMPRRNVVRYEIFRGVMKTWPELFEQASAFATNLGPDRLISISHSEDQQDGVIAVWYWGEARDRVV